MSSLGLEPFINCAGGVSASVDYRTSHKTHMNSCALTNTSL